MTDPRVAPVEDNLLSFLRAMADLPRFQREPADDVVAAHSEVAFPLFNPISGARFAPEVAGERTRQLLASYVDRGLPFLWWLTPSTTSPELEAALDEAGLGVEQIPGMHVALDRPITPALREGVSVVEVGPDEDPQVYLDTMVEGFGMPTELVPEFGVLLKGFTDGRMVTVLATLDGQPAASGSAWLDGTTIGLYNIATLEGQRGRGLGYAVTAFMMELGRQRGCTEAVLHSSEMGRPIYERLGFETVCEVPQYFWMPQA